MALNRNRPTQRQSTRIQNKESKLPEDMVITLKIRKNLILNKFQEIEIKDSFRYYKNDQNLITRPQFRNILGNFAFHDKNVKEIDDDITRDFDK